MHTHLTVSPITNVFVYLDERGTKAALCNNVYQTVAAGWPHYTTVNCAKLSGTEVNLHIYQAD